MQLLPESMLIVLSIPACARQVVMTFKTLFENDTVQKRRSVFIATIIESRLHNSIMNHWRDVPRRTIADRRCGRLCLSVQKWEYAVEWR